MNETQAKASAGSAILIAAFTACLIGVCSPTVAEPASRILSSVASALDAERAEDWIAAVETVDGVAVGAPVYFEEPDGDGVPIAHVVTVERAPARLRLRFEPGVETAGPWRVSVYPPRRSLGGSFELAIPPEIARRLGRAMRDRLQRLWSEDLGPELEARLPGFLERIDPSKDTEAKKTLAAVSAAIVERLEPHLDDLTDEIARAIEERFDFLDRMGLLWKVVKGDAEGLKDEMMPVATKTAQRWWHVHQVPVLGAIAEALDSEMPQVSRWIEGELYAAVREELVEPVLAEHEERLEAEGEALFRLVLDEAVLAPAGGFRPRFAAMLRSTLLRKKTALLLIERPETRD